MTKMTIPERLAEIKAFHSGYTHIFDDRNRCRECFMINLVEALFVCSAGFIGEEELAAELSKIEGASK